VITDALDTDDAQDTSPMSHPLALDTLDVNDTPRPLEAARQPRLRSHPIRYGEFVAHLSDYSLVLVITCCDPKRGKARRAFLNNRTRLA
jgi:hypothetical protein